MSVIGRSVQLLHIVGVILISSICLYNLGLRTEAVGQVKADDSGGALIAVDSPKDDDEDDGVVTVENSDEDEIDESIEHFEATTEWKTVKKGQKIPAGLHVRLDLQTGQKEAKLMDSSTPAGGKNIESWDAGGNIGIINTEKKRYTRDELKAALKDFKYKDETPADTKREEKVKSNFRSYEELKKEMQDMNMSVKTEGQIVSELTAKLQKPEMDSSVLKTILIDLEYYLHQIDNALVFCDNNGMKTMLTLLNHTESEIREAVVHALGAALQSNSKAQVAAVDSGLMQHLLKVMTLDPEYSVRKKTLFAVSTLLRQFPYAQKKFLQQAGLSALQELFVNSKEEKLQIKIITLLTDLLLENEYNIRLTGSGDKIQAERAKQYTEVNLKESMSKTGWCKLMASLLQSPSGHDSVEKVVMAMSALVDACKHEFSPARSKLQALLSQYQELAREETREGSDDDFFSSIYSTLQGLVSEIYREDL